MGDVGGSGYMWDGRFKLPQCIRLARRTLYTQALLRMRSTQIQCLCHGQTPILNTQCHTGRHPNRQNPCPPKLTDGRGIVLEINVVECCYY